MKMSRHTCGAGGRGGGGLRNNVTKINITWGREGELKKVNIVLLAIWIALTFIQYFRHFKHRTIQLDSKAASSVSFLLGRNRSNDFLFSPTQINKVDFIYFSATIFLTHTNTHFFTLSLSLTFTLTLSLSLIFRIHPLPTVAHSYTLFHIPTLYITHTQSHTRILFFSLFLPFPPPLLSLSISLFFL